jgi:dTDP-4-dehydrorhamnose 3,5-epimerase
MMLDIIDLGLERVCEIVPRRFGDERGFFSETYHRARFVEAGITEDFVQDNHSYSASAGTLRGLHFQRSPMAQAKLVRVMAGSVFDVAVDIRRDSADFGKWVGVTLSAEKGNQIFVPAGFAHGFVTLEPGTHVTYKVDSYYSPEHDQSVRFDDPLFGIDWPLPPSGVILSLKDRQAPLFEAIDRHR